MSEKVVIIGQAMGKTEHMRRWFEEAEAQGIDAQVVSPEMRAIELFTAQYADERHGSFETWENDTRLVSDGAGGYTEHRPPPVTPRKFLSIGGVTMLGPRIKPKQTEEEAAANIEQALAKKARRAARNLKASGK